MTADSVSSVLPAVQSTGRTSFLRKDGQTLIAQKPPDMRTRALATVSCIPAFRFSKWRRTNQNLTRHCGRCQAAVLALRIFQHR